MFWIRFSCLKSKHLFGRYLKGSICSVSAVNTGHWAQKTKSVILGGMNEIPLKPSCSRVGLLDTYPIPHVVRRSPCYKMGLIPLKRWRNWFCASINQDECPNQAGRERNRICVTFLQALLIYSFLFFFFFFFFLFFFISRGTYQIILDELHYF